ncbi:MAG: phosphoribosylanthranilate isomerase [Oscillospiraceae bacterium]|nr:phosphoribosylanthranilate isomerase [Oscillospiraceae bacterium]
MSKVKICGLSREEDVEAVNRVLPDFIGFVFAPSRRRVDIRTAVLLREKLDMRIGTVGVFVNEDIDAVTEIYQNGIIDLAQLHGDEDDEYIKRLKANCGCSVIKVVGIGDVLPSLPVGPDYLLFDALSEQRGGMGRSFDWNVLEEYCGLPFFLSGGLSAANVAASIHMLNPFCVDVSSGVETDGIKDADKIKKFVDTVRGI